MLKRFLPRQDQFFILFQRAVDQLQLAAIEFSQMMKDLEHQQHPQQYYVDRIATYEEIADHITHDTFELLHQLFITPFDRYDIHQLTSTLDDILDLINRITQRFPFYQLQNVPNELIMLADMSAKTTEHVKNAIYLLHSLKNASSIFQQCDEIDHTESEAHHVVLVGEKKLFLEEHDFKQFFKLKEVYSHVKQVINRCQDLANIIRGIVLEYS